MVAFASARVAFVLIAAAPSCFGADAKAPVEGGGAAPPPPEKSRGPRGIRTLHRLGVKDLLGVPEPVLIESENLRKAFEEVGLSGFEEMKRRFGEEQIIVGEEAWTYTTEGERTFDYSNNKETRIRDWISLMQEGAPAPRLSAIGGTEFFLRRPEVLAKLVRAFHTLLPIRFRKQMDPAVLAADWNEAWKDNVDLMLWAADGTYVYTIHQDYVVGNILYHIEGKKRIRLYPPEQQHKLYLRNDRDPDIWEANTLVPIDVQMGKAPLPAGLANFSTVEYIEVNLSAGEAIFLPCTWAHQVWYDSPALSVGYTVGDSSQEGCAELIPGAVDYIVSDEEFEAIASELWGDKGGPDEAQGHGSPDQGSLLGRLGLSSLASWFSAPQAQAGHNAEI